MVGINQPKFSSGNSFLDRANYLVVKRPKILAYDPSKITARFHGLALHEPGIVRMGRQKVEISKYEGTEALARRMLLGRRRGRAPDKLPQKIFENGPMETSLVSEIVIEHSLIRMRRRRNFIGPGPGHSFGGEMLLGGGQDSLGGRGILYFSTSAGHGL